MLALLTQLALAAPDPGGPGDLAPDRDWDLQHLHLDLAIHPDDGVVEGTVTLRIAPLLPGSSTLRLNQRALEIRAVRVDGAQVEFLVDDTGIEIPVHRPESHAEVSLDYRATPRTGLHFRRPGRNSPDTYTEVWSQGEGPDNRHWFPSWDYPNDRFTTSGRFVVPRGYKVLSNGLGSFDGAAWNYRLEQDLVNYLVMVAVGPYQERSVQWRDKEVRQWFPPDATEEEVVNASGRITHILEFFSDYTGLEYPYPLYTEVYVQGFLYTGMENTTATVEDRKILHPDEIADTMRFSPSVVAHEAAHQWYGDALTCRTWNDLWLNEGFATYFAGLWLRENEGEAAFIHRVRKRYGSSLDRGAMAGRWWSRPGGNEQQNDGVYVKGASVLQMLRIMFGDAAFQEAIRLYTVAHAHQLVETADLQHAFEQVTGQHLQWFFDAWTHLPGSPVLNVEQSWKDGVLTVTLKQPPPDNEAHPFFRMPVDLEIGTDTEPVTRRVWMDEPAVKLLVNLEAPPGYVAVDPKAGLLAKISTEQSTDMWIAQLASSSPNARFEAIHQLGERRMEDKTVAALVAVLTDTQTATEYRLDAIRALGKLSTDVGNAALAEALKTGAPARIRNDAAIALGKSDGAGDARSALAASLRRETNPQVRGEVLTALARHDKVAAQSHSRSLLKKSAPLRAPEQEAAARVLGRHGATRELNVLLGAIFPGQTRATLHASAWAAASIVSRLEGREKELAAADLSRELEPLLDSLDQRTRQTAVSVLGRAGDSTSSARLMAYASAETVVKDAESARSAASRIRRRGSGGEAEEAELEARLDDVEERLEQLEEDAKKTAERH